VVSHICQHRADMGHPSIRYGQGVRNAAKAVKRIGFYGTGKPVPFVRRSLLQPLGSGKPRALYNEAIAEASSRCKAAYLVIPTMVNTFWKCGVNPNAAIL
jgi:hypothetical protein